MEPTAKIILITGASSGIGEATARLLGAQGHIVVLGARRIERTQSIASEIAEAGGTAAALPLDVTDLRSFETFVDEARTRFGRIDVLVNNAGVMPLSLISEVRVDDWNRMVDVNLKGVLHGIAAVHPIMSAQHGGHIVNIGSVAAHRVDPTAAVYCATKYAVRALTDGLRQESRDIRVTMVSPGLTRSELLQEVRATDMRAMLEQMADDFALPAEAIASAVGYAIAQPANVDVNEIIVRSTAQG